MATIKRMTKALLAIALMLVATSPASAQDANTGSIEAAKELRAKESYVRPPDVI